MTTYPDASRILDAALGQLDIPEAQADAAVQEFENVALWLADETSPLAKWTPELYPQGSFRLGTPVRPLTGDEFDIDLVCKLDVAKEAVSQKELKSSVGNRLRDEKTLKARIKERRRCWSLSYPPEFHLDVLPAIPNPGGESGDILLTDRELLRWQFSNPIGYSSWFYERMRPVLQEARAALAKASGASIEEIPEWRVRTPLQRAVQLLKRHRDVRFQSDPEKKPVSIIITTLAAKAYRRQPDLVSTIVDIVGRLPDQVERRGDKWWVANPAQPNENVADKWNEDPERREAFLRWLDVVASDLQQQTRVGSERDGNLLLERQLMPGVAVQRSLAPTVVPVADDMSHLKPVPWPKQVAYEVAVKGDVHREIRVGRRLFELMRLVPKRVAIRFHATTNAPKPYEVRWQVTNTGTEARNAKQLRGGFEAGEGENGATKWETTKYRGTHFVQAFVVKAGVLVAQSERVAVRIGR